MEQTYNIEKLIALSERFFPDNPVCYCVFATNNEGGVELLYVYKNKKDAEDLVKDIKEPTSSTFTSFFIATSLFDE
jgi:hypothetical protein